MLPKINVVYFCSFYGQYNDHPKYISIELYNSHPEINQVWCKSEKNNEHFPPYIKNIKFESFLHYFYIYNAKVVVDNYFGLRSFIGEEFGIKSKLYQWLSNIDDNQLNIATWHGTPLKCIGFDSFDYDSTKHLYSCVDYSLAGCSLTHTCLLKAFRNSFDVRLYGTPRNDIFWRNLDALEIKNKLCLPLNKKVLLYAPTFRNDVENSGISQLKNLNIDKLLNSLSQKFGGEWVIVCRFHSHVMNLLNKSIIDGIQIIDGNIGDDMSDYLYVTDVLLTDYSSSMFDFALTGKPCFLYTPDKDYYIKQERGSYINIEKLPFPPNVTCNELFDSINNFNNEIYKNKVNEFLINIGNIEDGQASKRIVDSIYTFITEKRK